MWFVLVLIILATGDGSAASGAIEKLSQNIIRNISTYHNFYPSLDDEIVFTDISTDLIDWKYDGVILKRNTAWATGAPIMDVDINVIGPNKVRLYYTALSAARGRYDIGVASAESLNVSSNFATRKKPLVVGKSTFNLNDPCLVSLNNGSLLLTFGNNTSANYYAVILNDDGTDLASNAVQIVTADQDWEGGKIQNQWGFQRGNYIYIFYETGTGAVGVARSTRMLGPYEKILLTRAKKSNRLYFKNDLKWGKDDWPVYEPKKRP